MQSVQNLGLALITLLCGIIVDNGGYLMLEIFFLACLCGKLQSYFWSSVWMSASLSVIWISKLPVLVALVTVVIIYLYDSNHGGVLNMSAADREVYEKNRMWVMFAANLIMSNFTVSCKCSVVHSTLNFSLLNRSCFLFCSSAEDLEREKLVAAGSMSDITPQDLLQPHSDFHIRNRYLSRIGANVSRRLLSSNCFKLSFHCIHLDDDSWFIKVAKSRHFVYVSASVSLQWESKGPCIQSPAVNYISRESYAKATK